MSVVHRLPAGWLLDHLSFINQGGYELRGSSGCPGAAAASRPGLGPAPGRAAAAAGEAAGARYVFREELFRVARPHVAAAPEERLSRGGPAVGLPDTEANGEREGRSEGATGGSAAAVRKKRKRKCVLNQGELDALEYHSKVRKLIWEGTSCLVQEGLRSGFLQRPAEQSCRGSVAPGHAGCGLAELCDMAKQFPAVRDSHCPAVHVLDEETSAPEQDLLSCVTENSSSWAKVVVLMGEKYLVPPKSSFLLSDISYLQPLLNYKKKYDVIVIDPPWENKSVKRSNRYGHLPAWQVKQVPVPALAAPGCLVATWVTNRQKHLRFVKDELYPHWSVETLAEWHWVKITRAGEFVFPLDSLHKKPYEVLVLGRVQGDVKEAVRKSEDAVPIPEHQLIVSVPCSLHSHKPPLADTLTWRGKPPAFSEGLQVRLREGEEISMACQKMKSGNANYEIAVLAEFIQPDAECLELFARNLQPGWTSWGNEVLKFQHMDYFTLLQEES